MGERVQTKVARRFSGRETLSRLFFLGLAFSSAASSSCGHKDARRAERLVFEAEQLKGDWTPASRLQAVEKYREAWILWQAIGDPQKEAETARRLGALYLPMGKPEDALHCFESALHLAQAEPDKAGEGEALAHIGAALLTLGESEKALEASRLGLELSEAAGNARGAATALSSLGEAHYEMGDLPQAIHFLDRARSLQREQRDVPGQAESLLGLGYSYADLSQEQKALDAFRRALALFREVKDLRGEAVTLRALGSAYSKLDETEEALAFFSQARRLFQPMGDRMAEAALLNGMGSEYYRLGEKEKAIAFYKEAVDLYSAAKNPFGEGGSLVYLGRAVLALGRQGDALSHFERALALFRAIPDQRGEGAALGEIGKIRAARQERGKALRTFGRALDLRRATGDVRGQAEMLNEMGHLYARSKDAARARAHYSQALSLYRSAGDRSGEAATLYYTARAERALRRLDRARFALEAALTIDESLRAKVASEELRSSYFASIQKHYELYVDVLMQLHKARPREGLDAAALHANERARARSLLDGLRAARAEIRREVDPILLERERQLERQIALGLKNAKPGNAEKELRDLTAEYDQLQAEIRSHSPRYRTVTPPAPVGLEQIQKEILDENTILLEYALGEQRSTLWAVTPTTLTSHALPGRAEIEDAAYRFYALLTARQPVPGETARARRARVKEADLQYGPAARALTETLLGPVASQLEGKRLGIVADGALQYVPFGALAARDDVPLVAEHEIVQLPSASTLAELRKARRGRQVATKTVAVLADPVFETDDPRLGTASARSPRALSADLGRALRDVGVEADGVPRLLATRREAEAILSLVPPGAALNAIDFKASRETAESPTLAEYRIVHFATHGLLDNEHPELSGIVLSLVDEQGRPQDGHLRLHDIYNLRLPVDLVVLSACNTGLGKAVKGEGLVGVVRAFMEAGAARVVASSWRVDDEATGELMRRFYRHMLQEKLTPAAALRAAQVEIWRETSFRQPFYWAAFVLQGEWN